MVMSRAVIKVVSCGCCTNGCVCYNHMDIPRGVKPHVCTYHKDCKPTSYNKDFRWDDDMQMHVHMIYVEDTGDGNNL